MRKRNRRLWIIKYSALALTLLIGMATGAVGKTADNIRRCAADDIGGFVVCKTDQSSHLALCFSFCGT